MSPDIYEKLGLFYLGREVAKRELANPNQSLAQKVPVVPWFLVMFVVFAAISSLKIVPEAGAFSMASAKTTVTWLMCIGMAGVGLQTNLLDLARTGLRPLVVGVLQWAVLAATSLSLIYLL